MKSEDFLLSGLHCGSCARLVQDAASGLEGVESAVVDLAAQKLRLVHNDSFQFAKLEAAIRLAGFDVRRA